MKRALILLALLAAACGDEKSGAIPLSKEPISVRGWIADVEGDAPVGGTKTIETETARLTQLFQGMNIWVENAAYVSGGVAENGSFLLLDVPPGNVTIEFSPPNHPPVRLALQNIPGNADVLIPNILLKKDGTVALMSPKDVRVRIPASVQEAAPSGLFSTVAGLRVAAMKTPIASLVDRHDYPVPGGIHPVATFK